MFEKLKQTDLPWCKALFLKVDYEYKAYKECKR